MPAWGLANVEVILYCTSDKHVCSELGRPKSRCFDFSETGVAGEAPKAIIEGSNDMNLCLTQNILPP